MSRRKQSNPKPLKREDDDLASDSEQPATTEETTKSDESHPPTPTESPEPPKETTPSPKPPNTGGGPIRLRLNTSLATDPALRSQASVITQAPPAEPPEVTPPPPPSPQKPTDYLETLPPALQEAITAGRLFGFPPLVEPPKEVITVPLYMCVPCGIKFSSLSTLEAHQTYYCSHRKPTSEQEETKSDQTDPSNEDSENPAKAIRTGKQYACTHCSYSADKKVSLNRHMRMHSTSPSTTPTNGDVPGGNTEVPPDRYCTDCDIRFSSTKTFRAHKLHYCGTRHMGKQSTTTTQKTSSCTSGSAPTSPTRTSPSPNHFLALPTNPTLIIPYSLLRSASVLTGSSAAGIPSNDAPCLYMNGAFQLVSQAITATKNTTRNTTSDILKSANKLRDSGAPLDLSVHRRTPELKEDDEKENFQRSPTPEQIICAPSLPGSPPLTPSPRRSSTTSSPKRKESRSNSPKVLRTTPKSDEEVKPNFTYTPPIHPLLMNLPPLTPELALRMATDLTSPIAPTAPQVLVKQGVSKCKECNIVFCKHENYVAHKKHYCSARDDTKSPSPKSPLPEKSPTTQYQQLICAACGIKFTSLDNLQAHQAYYCLKRGELKSEGAELRRCVKCKGVAEPGHQCAQQAGWKCPCCDVVSATASAAQRHMETHSGVKAYRCTICRYKGNTLRGMRTHIRMHLKGNTDKNSSDFQEENYITCVLEDERVASNQPPSESDSQSPGLSRKSITPQPVSRTSYPPPPPTPPETSEKSKFYDSGNYSTNYASTLIQHPKITHSAKSDDDDTVSNGGTTSGRTSMPLLDEIKKEQEEMEVDVISEDVKPEGGDFLGEGDVIGVRGSRYCKSCDIPFNYYKSYIAHKKFYCSSHAGEIQSGAGNNNNRQTETTSVL